MVQRTQRVILALACPAFLLGGCEEDATSKAIREAHVELTALTSTSGEYNQATLTSLIQDLRSATGEGTDAQRAAAQILIARAEFGLAAVPAREAAAAEARAADMLGEIRSLYRQYLTIRSLADANASYNPGEELAELDQQIDTKDREVADVREDKAELDQRIQTLRDQAARLREQAGALRLKEREQRDAVLAAEDPDKAATLMEETQRVRREADAFDVDAAKLDARADQIAPESELLQGEIDKLLRQQQLLSEARAETVQRADDSRRMAEELSSDARDAASELEAKVSELDTLREETLAPAIDRAISAYEKARSAAAQARSQSRKAASVMVAEAQQAVGDLASQHAIGLAAYADTLASVGASNVEGAENFAARAEQARAAHKEWLERAAEAYTSAAESYGGEGLPADLTAAAERLRARAGEGEQPQGPAQNEQGEQEAPAGDTPQGG